MTARFDASEKLRFDAFMALADQQWTDMRFAATRLAGFDEIARLPGGEDLSDSLLAHILEEVGKFAAGLRRAEAASAA